jgi:hypothetical protein
MHGHMNVKFFLQIMQNNVQVYFSKIFLMIPSIWVS